MATAPPSRDTGTPWGGLFGALVVRAIAAGARAVPRPARPGLGSRVGDIAYRAVRRQREIALRNLAAAYPEWSEDEVERVARACFRHLGKTLIEFFALQSQSAEQVRALVSVEGMERLHEVLSDGGGAIILSAHYGNWELAAARLGCEGIPVNVIGRLPSNRHVRRLITPIREQKGYRVLPRSRSMTPYLECLRRNELVCLLIDANNSSGDLFVPFFGRPAVVPRGAAVLALRSGRPVLPVFSARRPDQTHLLEVGMPMQRRAGRDVKRAVEEWMAEMTALIEARIRRDPTQWLWIHDRWKRSASREDAAGE